MKKFRVETDSLGPMRIASDRLYGAQTARALENFPISGRIAHPSLIRAMLRVKRAAAIANRRSGALSPGACRAILRAIDSLLKLPEQTWALHFPIDAYQAGAGTSQNMNVNEVIANLASRLAGTPLGSHRPIHPNDHVNRSQSTNDTFPTAMRLALLEESSSLLEELRRIARTFTERGRDWRAVLKAARTHLQDAVPITLGREFQAYGLTLERCARDLTRSRSALRELGLGGSAAGTAINVPPGFRAAAIAELARLTGEPLRSAPDLVEAMQSQGTIATYSSGLRATAIELSRICNDLRLLASGPLTGLAELRLPAVQPGSSIMPGKVNPSMLEMTNQVAFAVMGYDQTIALAAQAGQLELNVMMPVMAYSGIEATRILAQALKALRQRCIAGIVPDTARLRHYFESTPQIATALSPLLGYERTARLVQRALREHRSVLELVRSERLLSPETLQGLLEFRALTGLRREKPRPKPSETRVSARFGRSRIRGRGRPRLGSSRRRRIRRERRLRRRSG